MNKRVVIGLGLAVMVSIGAILATIWLVPRNVFLMTVVEQMAPGVIPSSSYACNLDSANSDVIRESLAHLTDRKDPLAVTLQ